MIFDMISNMISIILVMALSVFTHECGHYWAVEDLTQSKPKVKFSKQFISISANLTGLKPKQRLLVYWAGVGSGLVPILIYIWSTNFIIITYIALLFWYFYGCTDDIKKIYRVLKSTR